MSNVVIVGQGYVGLPLAMRAVEAGHHVWGVESDSKKRSLLHKGESYIEDVSSERLNACISSGKYFVIEKVGEAFPRFDIAIITVPTPLREGIPDLSFVEKAALAVGEFLQPGATVILESTSYPGTTEKVVLPILEEASGLKLSSGDFHLGFSPERIDPGNDKWDFQSTPKLVSGITEQCLERTQRFYESVCDSVVLVSSAKAAELAKVFENTFRAVNIALVNELAMIAHDLNIPVWEVLDAAGTKPFGFMKFSPGPGIGGHCIGVDDKYLSWQVDKELGRPFRFAKLAETVNSGMPTYVVQRVSELLNLQRKSINGSRILILGVAYKPNTTDTRESPAFDVIRILQDKGAKVEVSDPVVPKSVLSPIRYESDDYSRFDLVVLLTAHDKFDYTSVALGSPLILDCRHKITQGNVVYL